MPVTYRDYTDAEIEAMECEYDAWLVWTNEQHDRLVVEAKELGVWQMPRKQTEVEQQNARISEAKAAIHRLRATMYTGNNRYGEYGDNCRAAIKRWEETIADATNALERLANAQRNAKPC